MDTSPMPPNSPTPPEGAPRFEPANLQPGTPEQAPRIEAVPVLGSTPAPDPAASVQPARLSPADVAAAIASVPGPSGPSAAVSGSVPAVADDVDVIEPEWVSKAEAVIQQHQGDPYGEEEAIQDLQQDYLKKRYGYDVADPKGVGSKPDVKSEDT